jgi:hypothetical protein
MQIPLAFVAQLLAHAIGDSTMQKHEDDKHAVQLLATIPLCHSHMKAPVTRFGKFPRYTSPEDARCSKAYKED